MDLSFNCPHCNVTCTTQTVFDSHLAGKKHLAKMKQILAGSLQEKKSDGKEPFKCHLCNFVASNKYFYDDHMNSKEHRAKVEEQQQKKTPNFECKVCTMKMKNKTTYDKHMNSAEHRKRVDNFQKGQAKPDTAKVQKKARSKSKPPGKHLQPLMASTTNSLGALSLETPMVPPPPYTPPAPYLGATGAVPKQFAKKKESVGIFWDIENCPLKKGVSLAAFVSKVRTFFVTEQMIEAIFLVVMNLTRPDSGKIITTLRELAVTIEPSIPGKKNASDEVLRQKMRLFADSNTQKCTMLLISGDVDFSADLHNFRHIKNHEILLMHNFYAKETLKSMANKCFYFNGFLKSIEGSDLNAKPGPEKTKALQENAKIPQQSTKKNASNKEEKETPKHAVIFWDLHTSPLTTHLEAINFVSQIRTQLFSSDNSMIEAIFAASVPDKDEELIKTLEELSVVVSNKGTASHFLKKILANTKQEKFSLGLVFIVAGDVKMIELLRKLRFEDRVPFRLLHPQDAKPTLIAMAGAENCESMEDFMAMMKSKEAWL